MAEICCYSSSSNRCN